MRIAIVSAFFEAHRGGIEIVAGAMARSLARRGHDVVWLASDIDPAPAEDDFSTVSLATSDPLERFTGLPLPIPHAAARRRLAREIDGADAVIVHDALYVTSVLASRCAQASRKPWILVQHIGAIPYSSPVLRAAMGLANRAITRPLLERAPQAIFISDAVRATFQPLNTTAPAELMFNGVDHRLFAMRSDAERTATRCRLGFADHQPQVLFVGRFVEKKGLAQVRRLAEANPAWQFNLAGAGPIDPRRWNLPNVRVLGRQTREALADLYAAADVLVLPSVGEGFPLVIQEAMACGLPVVCGRDSAEADPRATRFLGGVDIDLAAPQRTAERLSQAIASRIGGRDEAAARYAAEAYDWDRNAERLERRIGELVAGRV